jgi:putative toxin-antitoxin system antitoxin component (TIGR02293 family)
MAVVKRSNVSRVKRHRDARGVVVSFLLGQREIDLETVLNRLPAREVEAILELGLTQKEVAALLGVSERTLARQLTGAGRDALLSVAESDRLVRVARVLEFAIKAFDEPAIALGWLRRPVLALGERVPLELIQTEQGTLMVLRSLATIVYGGVV